MTKEWPRSGNGFIINIAYVLGSSYKEIDEMSGLAGLYLRCTNVI